jgi:hypothetical protein
LSVFHKVIAGVHCEQDHCRFWGSGANLSGRFQTIHTRHRQVQDDDIRAKGFDSFDRNSSILCLTANSPIARCSNQDRSDRWISALSSTINTVVDI